MNMSMYFNIDIDLDRRVITAKINGIWKAETAEDYHNDYVEVSRPLHGKEWAKLTILTNWKSSYPEIINILGEHMQWSLDHGAVFSVYVIDNPVTMRQLKQMIERSRASDITKLFRTVKEAEKYLEENGY